MTQTDLPQLKTFCGGKMKNPDKFPSAIYRDEKIYFCDNSCLKEFEKEPDNFIAGKTDHHQFTE